MSRARRLPSAAGLQLEAALLGGGLRALLLQLTHPAVGHGVADHSDFATDPLARLHGTLVYVYVVAAGGPAALARVTERVNRLHGPVVSAPGEQLRYDANGAGLQLWVTLTLADTAVRIVEAVWGRLPEPLLEELIARMGALGTTLGMPGARWPTTRPEFDAAVARGTEQLTLDDTTRAVIAALFRAEGAPRWVRAALPFLVAATLPTLPALRAELEPLVPVRVPDLLPLVRRVAPVYRALPASLRRLPARRILDAERRGAAGRTRVGAGT
ncbi:oxygenase MpaB family protein [Amnibacterium sp. CER49]|uniref:oxygenase MpaB family protein n=1 Tax=Amnibacterium sp. CER49 TaxID=3039161 RepID=UPI002446CCD7|nr:oxygenase MpaB family protein [Amnibacterium sp. CER49]MDH2442418.1 oxygenase MpaB family protein [Amnibacterium sp. CER49]